MEDKVAVILWLYHTDLMDEFTHVLAPLSHHIHLYIGLCEDKSKHIEKQLKKCFNNLTINYFPNVGGDVLPFLEQFVLVPEQQKYFIKIHSKKSLWGPNNICNWRAMLLDSMIGDLDTLYRNISFMDQYNLGAIGCRSLLFNNWECWHSQKIQHLCQYLNLNVEDNQKYFFGGNMFIGRT